MLDVSVSYNRFKFLGPEFLTWLWYAIENDPALLDNEDTGTATLEIGNRLVLENKKGSRSESITIKGDDAGLEEGLLALRKGSVVTELNLSYKINESEWRFTVKGESLHVSNLKCPSTGSLESEEDIEGSILEKVYLCEKPLTVLDGLFTKFIRLRISETWTKKTVPQIRHWAKVEKASLLKKGK